MHDTNQNTTPGKVHVKQLLLGWALLLCALMMSMPAARAQVLYGSLTGTVTDSTGAVIPNTSVVLTNQGTAEARTITTNGAGEYIGRDLAPGTYSITVQRAGAFAGFTQKNIAVDANRQVRIDITLQPSTVSIEVTVDTAPPMLQTETAEVNHQISQSQLSELPVGGSQGRNFQQLYSLIPGTTPPIEENSTSSNPARSVGVNVNGIANVSNTTRIDGAVNTYGWLPYIIAYVPPADAIAAVNIVTNSFNAEQGTAGGASINVMIKGGTNQFHGSVWEYNQLFNTNARGYTQTVASGITTVPKNIFNQYGFSIGGPVYIPKILTGKKKLFFFQDFERTTRRQSITGLQTVPTTAMLGGDFSAVASITPLYDPQPGGVGPYLPVGSRPTFMSEYGCNCIPAARQSQAAAKMLALLQPISSQVSAATATSLYSQQLANDFNGSAGSDYNRIASDSKVTYNPTDRTSIFGRYSVDPYNLTDPQELGMAGGGTFDGGQPGATAGRIQNIGLGVSHVITPNLLVDADFGFTRQHSGAQSSLDIADGDFGLNTLGIPGTNGTGPNYVGQPAFTMPGGSTFSSLGNSNGANPFLFRDNQYTGDVNLSWTKGKHAMKFGAEYYHFALNHFQPTSGSGINNPRGGFTFQGGMTSNSTNGITAYNSLADFLLGLPNNGTGLAVAKATQLFDPNALRWSAFSGYAQDQWSITSKLTLNFGARYEFYPTPVRDHEGVFRFDPTLPLSGNVEAGGVNGNPINAGINVGWGLIVPRVGIAYRVNDRTVVRAGGGITEDPDNFRFLRDTFPVDLAQNYSGTASNTVAVDPSQNNLPLTLAVGIPAAVFPSYASGFASLPPSQTTTTIPKNFRRGYIESWNLFVEQDLGSKFVANIGYVGNHEVRQITSIDINPGPLPSGSTICMANGQYNPSSGFATHPLGSNPCSFNANEIMNVANCPASAGSATCYNTTGIGSAQPTFSAEYNGLQAQLSRNAGRLAQFGLVYTWSHAINFADNSSYAGPSFAYPAYFSFNRATASYDHTNNLQFWGIYHLPFGHDQMFVNHGIASAILGGIQLNGQLSHVSGQPFSVNAQNNNINSPGQPLFADLVKPYHQIGGHARTVGGSSVSGGQPWFDPTSFANPVEPTYTATQSPASIVAPHFGSSSRNEFRGPGQTNINASVFRGFHLYRESEFQIRVEAFNLLNHPQISICGASTSTVCTINYNPGSTFNYITSFGSTRTLQFSGRFNF
jgi:hypothetical protein